MVNSWNKTKSEESFQHIQEIYEGIARDVDAAMKAGVKAAKIPNKGFKRSPALTRAASFVRFWRRQLAARRNNVGLSCRMKEFASVHSLPVSVQAMHEIKTELQKAWKHLRKVQSNADKER